MKGSRPFFPVHLHCSREENLKRVVSPQRARHGKKKLRDVGVVEHYLDTTNDFVWEGEGVSVNNTHLTPTEAAETIIAALVEHANQMRVIGTPQVGNY